MIHYQCPMIHVYFLKSIANLIRVEGSLSILNFQFYLLMNHLNFFQKFFPLERGSFNSIIDDPIVNYPILTSNFQFSITIIRTSHFALRTSHFTLRTLHFTLYTSHFNLYPSAFCLLPSAFGIKRRNRLMQSLHRFYIPFRFGSFDRL